MKSWPIVTLALRFEVDIVAARQRARRIAGLVGFDTQDQTRVATAVSEIARNAHSYGKGGKVEFLLTGRRDPESLAVVVSDEGAPIADPDAILEGRAASGEGLGLGVAGARRLMDEFSIESRPGGGARVAMAKTLPPAARPFPATRIGEIARALARARDGDAMDELRAQNRELLDSLEALEARREEAARLAEELERTNKGVVALYAEIDRKAMELQQLNETLEQRIAEGVRAREKVEESLRQSLKMEAVGQLTGGIAHDFNNLLMIIGGSLQMLRRRVPPNPMIAKLLDAASEAVARGGSLNRQLLAFARRQDLREEVVRLDDLLPGILQLVERAVSEDISIRRDLQADLWHCRTDPHQLETAVLNLAINARDAMPDGGVLTLRTGNRTVEPAEAGPWGARAGDYVVIAVADTGVGMSAETIAHAFEPFFTTKEVGQGTGLGLSQVYGFAQQSGGFVSIDSAPGQGACVMIHLPRAAAPAPAIAPKASAPALVRGTASVLVVEDDEAVRATTSALLRDLGYAVFEAASARDALAQLREARVDLVFSDVILPDGMSGVDLAAEIRRHFPALPVLLTSGYTAQRLNLARATARYALLKKPYSEAELSEAVSAALVAAPTSA